MLQLARPRSTEVVFILQEWKQLCEKHLYSQGVDAGSARIAFVDCCIKASSRGSEKVKVKSLSRVRLFATPRTVAHQSPPSVEFSRQEYWSGLPFPSPGDLPNSGIEPRSPHCRQTLYCLSHQGIPRGSQGGLKSRLCSVPRRSTPGCIHPGEAPFPTWSFYWDTFL